MPTAPFWSETPQPWDTLVLGGVPLPGLTKVTGKIARKIDIRSPPGRDGARVRDRGYEPGRFTAEVRVFTPEQLEALEVQLATLNPRRPNPEPPQRAQQTITQAQRELTPEQYMEFERSGQLATLQARAAAEQRAAQRARTSLRTPVDVVHPALTMLGVRSCYVLSVSAPEVRSQVCYVTIELLEWTPTPPPAPRPRNASRGSEGGGLDSIRTAFDRSRNNARPIPSPPSRTT